MYHSLTAIGFCIREMSLKGFNENGNNIHNKNKVSQEYRQIAVKKISIKTPNKI